MKTLYVVHIQSTGSFEGATCGPRIFTDLIAAAAFMDIICEFGCIFSFYTVK